MKEIVMKKPSPLKTRGVRFSEDQWTKLHKEAAKDKTKRTKASDIVRYAVDEYLEKYE